MNNPTDGSRPILSLRGRTAPEPSPVQQTDGDVLVIQMTEKSQNVQDVFLNHIRRNKTPITIFLVNGVKLQGIITWFDNFSVLLRRESHSQLVYKHAISTIMPSVPVQLYEPPKEGDPA